MIDECWYYSEWTCYTFIATWGEMSFEFSCISLTFMLVGIRYESIIVSEGWENNLLYTNIKTEHWVHFPHVEGWPHFRKLSHILFPCEWWWWKIRVTAVRQIRKWNQQKNISIITSIFLNIDAYCKKLCVYRIYSLL